MVLTQERDLGISLQVLYFTPWVEVMEFKKKGKNLCEKTTQKIFFFLYK